MGVDTVPAGPELDADVAPANGRGDPTAPSFVGATYGRQCEADERVAMNRAIPAGCVGSQKC